MLHIFEKFLKKNKIPLPAIVIGSGTILRGVTFTQAPSIRIDGIILDGTISLNGCTVIIGPNGNMNGMIQAKHVIVAGRVTGDITCSEIVELTSTAVVTGDITAKSIVIDAGAKINGICKSIDLIKEKEEEDEDDDQELHEG